MSVWLYLFGFCLYFSLGEGEIKRPRGVAISKATLYDASKDFSCLDGSLVIPFERINDDYCDCQDGSDEPGTSACPNGSFHCTNAGYKPRYIPSSRVNDAICDCCDGTDEFNGKITCANYCRELGKQFREEQDRERKLVIEGHEIYKEYCVRGKEAIKEKQIRLEAAKQEKDELEVRRDELEAAKLNAEIPEKEAKEKHKEAWDVEKDRKRVDSDRERSKITFTELDNNNDNLVTVSEIQENLDFDIDSNGEVSLDEAKEYLADLEQVDYDTFFDKVWIHIRDIYKKPPQEGSTEGDDKQEDDKPGHVDLDHEGDDDDDGHDDDEAEDDDDHRPDPEDYDIDDYDDDFEGDNDDDKKKEGDDSEMPEYDDATKALIQAADEARNAYNEVNRDFNNLDKEIKDLEKLVSLDLGQESEFYPLKGECYEYTDREYTYKLCPFEKCTQRGKHGGVETSLGIWENWSGEGDKKYSVMHFTKGQNCWNGPDRSVKVKVTCGVHNEVKSSSEPNRCEYEYTFTSPAACSLLPTPEEKDPNHDEL